VNAERLLVRSLAFALVLTGAIPAPARAFDHGADLSSLPRVEAAGARFHDGQGEADALTILHRAGVDAVRLRLWHTPSDSTSALPAVLAMARRAHASGMRLLLDLHFADTWADPAHQPTPAAWNALDFPTLADSTERWARETVADMVAQGTPPAIVQIGNEVDHGMMWERGHIQGNNLDEWSRFTSLLEHAARGVRAGAGAAPVNVMVHVSAGGDSAACRWFFDHLVVAGLRFDAIGVSYYPLWHGGIPALRGNLAMLARRYQRPVYVVETAYASTLRASRLAAPQIMGDSHALLPGLDASPESQAIFVRAVRSALADIPLERGAGLYWWEPAWVSAPGAPSPWENCTLFDSTGARLPAARALGAR
jgi:arabinogalactan endo-1,4-beta-galactosidase